MRIYLTGFMGVGKSTVGRLLAQRLGCPFQDVDEAVVKQAGRSIQEIFRADGEGHFRKLESEALGATQELPSAVIATGGGALISASNRSLLAEEDLVVWLDAPFELLAKRLARDQSRPLFREPKQAKRLYEQRLESYRQCDHRIRISEADRPRQLAQRILQEIN